MTYWIVTTDTNRRDDWHDALGMDSLPVTTPRPIMIRKGNWKRPYYMIDADALTIIQRMRLVGWVWKCQRVNWQTAVSMVEAGVLIDGRDCEVVEPMETSPSASLFAHHQIFAYAP